MARPFIDNFKFFVAIVALAGTMLGLTGMVPASAATLPAPGLQEPQPLFKVQSGETFSQQVIIPVGTNEIRLGGFGIGFPSIRGFKSPIVEMTYGKPPVVTMKSITPSGVPTNGSHRVLITAPSAPGWYKLEFRSCAPGKPGWRSDVWYEVTDDLVESPPDQDKEVPSGKKCCPPAPKFGDGGAPPLRFSGQLATARTLGQDPPGDVAIDHGFGRGLMAIQIAPQTDLRLGLAGGMARPAKDGSPYGWGEFVGPELALARQFGEYRLSGGFRWMANTGFGEATWVNTPVALIGGMDVPDWISGWARPEAELSLSPRHLGATGRLTARITPHEWDAWLGLFGGGMGGANFEKGTTWGRGIVGAAAGLPTALGSLDGNVGVAFAPNCPTVLIAGMSIRN